MRADGFADGGRIRRRAAGDACDRNVIDKARRIREHRGQALVVGGRRRQPDEIQPGLHRRQAQFGVFLRRQIDDDQTVNAGALGVHQEFVDAVDVDRIVVTHQHQRRGVVVLAKAAHHLQRLSQRHAAFSARRPAAWIEGRPPSDR
jgi:hypothetical protein